jgi:uncharacterized protein
MPFPTPQLEPYHTILPFKRIEFSTYDSTILRGNLHLCPHAKAQAPIIVFLHGIGLLKEQYLQNFSQYFLEAGYHVLVYDNRSFGDSEGLPRNHFDWKQQAEDFVDAVSYVRGLEEVDGSKVFGWGVAHGAGAVAT